MTRWIKLSVIAATAALTALPLVVAQPADAQTIQINPYPQQYPQQAQQPPRGGAWGDRDRDGIPNRVDRDRDGDGVPNRFDSRPDNPNRH